VLTSKIKPRTGTSFEIQGCDLTISIWSLVCCSGSLKAKKRIGAGVASPVSLENLAFNSASVKVVNPNFGPELAECAAADQMTSDVEGVVDSGMSGQKSLGRRLRFEPLLFAFPSPDRR
jgi:hypothetical protein